MSLIDRLPTLSEWDEFVKLYERAYDLISTQDDKSEEDFNTWIIKSDEFLYKFKKVPNND